MIISLTGFMGCGKSSVGSELSKLLCCPFMDLDDVIEERAGRSIPEIFSTDGEAVFRQMELETLLDIVGQMPICFRGSLPLRGPHSVPAAAGCSLQQSTGLYAKTLATLAGGGKMPLPHNWHTDQKSEDSDRNIQIVALGGGTVMTPECAEIVREQTVCIYLRTSVETLLEHLSGGEAEGRPMLEGASLRSRIEELMHLRASTYEKTAHIIIDTDGKSIEVIASEIVNNLLH